MKERPIIFSTAMVQAIIGGRKTVTRRLNGLGEINADDSWEIDSMIENKYARDKRSHLVFRNSKTSRYKTIKFPWEKGDILWVRESFMPFEINGKKYNYFKADDPERPQWKGKPSIHMPKAIACRWLQVESVRVERLNIMSHNDAILEGIHFDNDSGYYFAGDLAMASSAYDCFHELWVKIYGKESWDSNPWVWVIQFSVLSAKESQKHLDNARA